MNEIKAQQDIFKAMLSGKDVRKFYIDDNTVFITPEGYYGFVLPINSLQNNETRIRAMSPIDLKGVVNEGDECELADELRIDIYTRKRLFRKLKCGNKMIFINNAYLQWFQNARFYCRPDRPSVIVVTEDISPNRLIAIVGAICPIAVKNKDGADNGSI